jgi:hypothetical protein
MANKDNLIKLVARKLGPDNLKQMVDEAQKAIAQDPDITPEVIDEIIEMFEFVAENPEEYQSVVQEAIQTGAMDEGDLPPEFDPTTIAIILLAFYGLRDRMGAQQMPQQMPQMAKGGLSKVAQQLQSAGTGNDSILAHISPIEADMLRRRGGAGSINPVTGLREYGIFKKIGKAIKKVVKAVLPVAVSFIPGIGPIAAAALAGLGTAALGGNLKQSLLAGLGGALGTVKGMEFAGKIGQGLNQYVPGLNAVGLSNQVLGSGVLGGVSGAIAGKNPLTSALTAGITSYAAPKLADSLASNMPGSQNVLADMVRGANMSAQTGGNPLVGAGAAGLGSVAGNLYSDGSIFGAQPAPNVAGDSIQGDGTGIRLDSVDPSAYADPYALPTSQYGGSQGVTFPTPINGVYAGDGYQLPNAMPMGSPGVQGALTQTAQAGVTPTASTGVDFKDMAKLALVGSLLSGQTPTQAQQNIQDSELTAQQKEAMLRGLTNYKFDPGMTTFPAQGTPAYEKLMSDLSQGIQQNYSSPTLTEVKAKGGRTRRQPQGALSQMSYAVQGPGTGRSDSIEARLSDGEYVIDAETVALLGNGSTKAGAAMLDQMRQGIRQQKGKALAKGKFSPDAKSPLAYMKGGLR